MIWEKWWYEIGQEAGITFARRGIGLMLYTVVRQFVFYLG